MLMAYKHVMIALMLAEANYCAENLKLRTKLPIVTTELRFGLIHPPEIAKYGLCGGRVDNADYAFSFPRGGRLQYIQRLTPFDRKPDQAHHRSASVTTTNQAYSMATNWLTALSVDIPQLERTNAPEVRQQVCWSASGHKDGLLPIFEVKWGLWDKPKVEISIDGQRKELLYLRVEDLSFSRRPSEL
jgi:hypothetical protein